MEAALAIGIFAGVVVPIGFAWYREAKGHRQQAVLAAQEGARATGLAAQLANETLRANFQERRANALDAAIVRHSATRPIAGSFELLAARERANAGAADGDPAGLHHGGTGEPTTEVADPDRLLAPGE